jgi:hypothetical protein
MISTYKLKKLVFSSIIFSTILSSCSKGDSKENIIAYRETKEDAWGLMKQDGNIITKNEWDEETYEPIAVSGNKLLLRKKIESKISYEFYSIEEKPKQLGKSYKSATPFSEGLAGVAEENGRIQFINEEMATVFTLSEVDGFEIDRASTFKNGFARISTENDEIGYINNKGEIVVKPKYSFATQFSDNNYALCLKTPNQKRISEISSLIQRMLADSISTSLTLNMASVTGSNSEEVQKTMKNLVDELNKNRKSYKEESVIELNIINNEGKVTYEKKWFEDENIQINFKLFSNQGYFPYCDNKDDNWGVMDFNGEKIIKASSKFKGFSQIINDKAVYINEEGKFGIIDLKNDGEILIRAKYDQMYLSKSGEKLFIRTDKKWTIKDLNDTEILKGEYDDLLKEETENYLVKEGDKWVFVDEKGKSINNNDYYEIYLVSDDLFENMLVGSDYFNGTPTTNLLTSKIDNDSYLGFSFKGINVSEVADKYKLPFPDNTYYAYGQNISEFYTDKNFTISVSLTYQKMIIEQKMSTVAIGDYTTEQPDGWIYAKDKINLSALRIDINTRNGKASEKLPEILNQIKNSFAAKGFKKINDDYFESNTFNVQFRGNSITLTSRLTLYENELGNY